MVIGGLLQNNSSNSIDKAPFLGDLPILGALFRSNGFQRNETELVIVITPYLVKPVDSQSQIVLPTDGYRTPADYERLVVGNVGGYGQSGARRPVPTMAAPGDPATPAIGAAAPVGPAPSALPRGRETIAPAPKSKKGSAPMPGFSN
jgi:pilus assembly protein CpaC